eukprot:776331-Amphidinium_carterae.1
MHLNSEETEFLNLPPVSRPSSPEGSVVGAEVPLVPGSVPSVGLTVHRAASTHREVGGAFSFIEGGVSAAEGTSGLGDGVGAFREEGGTP